MTAAALYIIGVAMLFGSVGTGALIVIVTDLWTYRHKAAAALLMEPLPTPFPTSQQGENHG